jgi:hypothetical protein
MWRDIPDQKAEDENLARISKINRRRRTKTVPPRGLHRPVRKVADQPFPNLPAVPEILHLLLQPVAPIGSSRRIGILGRCLHLTKREAVDLALTVKTNQIRTRKARTAFAFIATIGPREMAIPAFRQKALCQRLTYPPALGGLSCIQKRI